MHSTRSGIPEKKMQSNKILYLRGYVVVVFVYTLKK